jgi:hypothetical protein
MSDLTPDEIVARNRLIAECEETFSAYFRLQELAHATAALFYPDTRRASLAFHAEVLRLNGSDVYAGMGETDGALVPALFVTQALRVPLGEHKITVNIVQELV